MSVNKHTRHHGGAEGRSARPDWRRLHHSRLFWVGLFMMLLAITIYVRVRRFGLAAPSPGVKARRRYALRRPPDIFVRLPEIVRLLSVRCASDRFSQALHGSRDDRY